MSEVPPGAPEHHAGIARRVMARLARARAIESALLGSDLVTAATLGWDALYLARYVICLSTRDLERLGLGHQARYLSP